MYFATIIFQAFSCLLFLHHHLSCLVRGKPLIIPPPSLGFAVQPQYTGVRVGPSAFPALFLSPSLLQPNLASLFPRVNSEWGGKVKPVHTSEQWLMVQKGF